MLLEADRNNFNEMENVLKNIDVDIIIDVSAYTEEQVDILHKVMKNGFKQYIKDLENEKIESLIQCIEELNNDISLDESLGDGFCIGHSYFCNLTSDSINDIVLSGIVEYEIIPLLKEYWFDEPSKVKNWSIDLRSAIK